MPGTNNRELLELLAAQTQELSESQQKGPKVSGSFSLQVPYVYLLAGTITLVSIFGGSTLAIVGDMALKLTPRPQTMQQVLPRDRVPELSAPLSGATNDVEPQEVLPSIPTTAEDITSTLGEPSYQQILDALIESIKSQESGGNPNAVSPAGARGLFQIMPSTLDAWYDQPPDLQYTIAEHMLDKMLSEQMKLTNGDWQESVKRVAATWYSGNPNYCSSHSPEYAGGIQFPSGAQYCNDILGKVHKQLS